MAIQYNSHQCRFCGHSFDIEMKEKYGLTQRDEGFFTKMHKLVKEHFKEMHPEYIIK